MAKSRRNSVTEIPEKILEPQTVLVKKAEPIEKKHFRFSNQFNLFFNFSINFIFIMKLYSVLMNYLTNLETDENADFFRFFMTNMINDWNLISRIIPDYSAFLFTWLQKQWDEIYPIPTYSREVQESFSNCIPYNEEGSIDQCYPAWRYSLKLATSYQRINNLHQLCEHAGEVVCVQTAMNLNVTQDNSYRTMAFSYYSDRLILIEHNLPLVHAAWERDPEIYRLLAHKNVDVNIQNQFGITPLMAFILGHIFQKIQLYSEAQIQQYAFEANFLLYVTDLNSCSAHLYYKHYFPNDELSHSGFIFQRKELVKDPALFDYFLNTAFFRSLNNDNCQNQHYTLANFRYPFNLIKDEAILNLLLHYKASLDTIERTNRTALTFAQQYNLTELVSILEEAQGSEDRWNIVKVSESGFFNKKLPLILEIPENENDYEMDDSEDEEIPEELVRFEI